MLENIKNVLYNIIGSKKIKKERQVSRKMTNEKARTDLQIRAEKRTYEFNEKNHEYIAFYVVVNGIPIDVKIKDKVGRIIVLQALGIEDVNKD